MTAQETNITLKQAQRKEALKRLTSLHLHENAVKDFQEGRLNLSERQKFRNRKKAYGILFWLDEEQEEKVREFEEKWEAVVYHVIKTFTEFGEQLSFLYVSKDMEEWNEDREEMKEGEAIAYTTDGWCGEIGRIGFEESGGGLIRTW